MLTVAGAQARGWTVAGAALVLQGRAHLCLVRCHLLGVPPHLRQILDGLEFLILAALVLFLEA